VSFRFFRGCLFWSGEKMEFAIELEIVLAAAARSPDEASSRDSKKSATWPTTFQTEEFHVGRFDVDSTKSFLQSKGHEIDLELLQSYAMPNRPVISLRRIGKFADWLKPLPDQSLSIRQVRETQEFGQLLKFTTPSISADGTKAFLELWQEDGTYPQMGSGYYVLVENSGTYWRTKWAHMCWLS
jgi:hypothetical protein